MFASESMHQATSTASLAPCRRSDSKTAATNRYSASISDRSPAMKAWQSAQSRSVICEMALLEISSSPVESRKASSTSRVDNPRAYISLTSRPRS